MYSMLCDTVLSKPKENTVMPKSKSQFMIQRQDGEVWKDEDYEVENTADAIRLIKEEKLVGDFRIISVRSLVSTVEKTVVDVTIESVTSDDD